MSVSLFTCTRRSTELVTTRWRRRGRSRREEGNPGRAATIHDPNMISGYSRRGLSEKLGIKPNTRVIALGAPPAYRALLAPLPSGATVQTRLSATSDFIHHFARRRSDLAEKFPHLSSALTDE